MERKFLEELGLAKEVIDQVLDENGRDIGKAKKPLEELTTQRDGLQAQLAQRDKDLETLKGATGDTEKIKTQLGELQTKYDQETKALGEKLAQAAFDGGLEAALLKAHARDTKAVRAMLDLGKVKQAQDGSFTGLEEQLGALRKEKAWAFGEPQVSQPYAPRAGGGTEPPATFQEAVRAALEGQSKP